jgi:DNA mismatch repair protein MutS
MNSDALPASNAVAGEAVVPQVVQRDAGEPRHPQGSPDVSALTSAAFVSILFPGVVLPSPSGQVAAPEYFRDLNLDQIVQSVIAEWQEYDLATFYHHPLDDLDAIAYRQEVLRDLEKPEVAEAVRTFSQQMRTARQYLLAAGKGYYHHERKRWLLDAAHTYGAAVESLAAALNRLNPSSRGLSAFRIYLSWYCGTDTFRALATDAAKLAADFAHLRYNLIIRDGSVTVRRYDGEPDYSAVVEAIFDKFRRGAAKDYHARIPERTGMDHIQAQIVDRVARLFPEIFQRLEAFCLQHADFADATVLRFDREVQFYMAYLALLQNFRAAGLSFCYPQLSKSSKELVSSDSFDLSLAAKCLKDKNPVVTNDFFMRGADRMFVVSGPNQGGKTTFARTFGQLHHLAALGLSVPGSQAQLFLFDQIFTHFEREENIETLRGKLQDDLVRIRHIVDHATPRSIVVLNELFQSTTLQDAVFLSKKIMARLTKLDVLGVWVTFLTELASFNDGTVSVMSMVDPKDPAIRTFKLERRPAQGLAYALAVAEKYHLTFEAIKSRIQEKTP